MYFLGVTKSKRKRKLIIDEVKNISGEEMKNQLSDTSDIGKILTKYYLIEFLNQNGTSNLFLFQLLPWIWRHPPKD